MKQNILKISTVVGFFLLAGSASLANATSLTLTNGGLGQVATNPQQFGVAVCVGAGQTLSQPVPVSVTANGKSETISSVASINDSACQYSYLAYSDFGMQAGETYSADVTIDPQHTVISNANNESVYSVTVPGQVAVSNTKPTNLTADIGEQFPNPLTWLWNWLGDVFRSF